MERSRERQTTIPARIYETGQDSHANTSESRPSRGADAASIEAARAAYKDSVTLWKDADPDIPILKEAKVEYAKLQ